MVYSLLALGTVLAFHSVAADVNYPSCNLAISGRDINGIFTPYDREEWREVAPDGQFSDRFLRKHRGRYSVIDESDVMTDRRYFRDATFSDGCLTTESAVFVNSNPDVIDKPQTYLTRIAGITRAPFIGGLTGSEAKDLGGNWNDKFEDCYKRASAVSDGRSNRAVGLEWDYETKACRAIFGCHLIWFSLGNASQKKHTRAMMFKSMPARGTVTDLQFLEDGVRDVFECAERARKIQNATYASYDHGKCNYSTKQQTPTPSHQTYGDEAIYLELDRYPNCPDGKLKITRTEMTSRLADGLEDVKQDKNVWQSGSVKDMA